jgi:hypothetical protein
MRRMSAIFIILAAVACASPNRGYVDALAPAADIGDTVECEGDVCKLYWERSKLWIIRHSQFKIQAVTDATIQTYKSQADQQSYGFTVIKEPIVGSTYRIQIGAFCGNVDGCDVPQADLKRAFYYYLVNGQDLLIGAGYMKSVN